VLVPAGATALSYLRQRVLDVKQLPDEESSVSYSLCRMLQQTLLKYDLAIEWDQVLTDQLYLPTEWTNKVRQLVLSLETHDRQTVMAGRSTLDCYSSALAPQIGKLAPYLLQSRNREGAWIQCRLRSETLPLMQTLGRQCHPPRTDVHAGCRLCDDSPAQPRPSPSPATTVLAADAAATMETIPTPNRCGSGNSFSPPSARVASLAVKIAVEGVTHFLAECAAPAMKQLRGQLCVRIRSAITQWQAAEQPQQPPPARTVETIRAIEAIVQQMERRSSSDPPVGSPDSLRLPQEVESGVPGEEPDEVTRAWCELILGRRRDPTTHRLWDPSLLQEIQIHTQNFLLLAWRTRAALMGGVPTLTAGGHGGIVMMPYRRMKSIGLRQVRVRRTDRPTNNNNHNHNTSSIAVTTPR
jgi:hypothetical protein